MLSFSRSSPPIPPPSPGRSLRLTSTHLRPHPIHPFLHLSSHRGNRLGLEARSSPSPSPPLPLPLSSHHSSLITPIIDLPSLSSLFFFFFFFSYSSNLKKRKQKGSGEGRGRYTASLPLHDLHETGDGTLGWHKWA
ncbi:hypothetical protein BDZ85DRAFT_131865 [Elsinoe ampelina]|uniref:Uncharacterized protein n=1 Tax=Elsinoe ampelina TaxID=302913 RepID=A0A6A6FXK7_9PEZI|nr:hypothetical protein BDZ85DRAFT_131865 [Elsinoe ampelina]